MSDRRHLVDTSCHTMAPLAPDIQTKILGANASTLYDLPPAPLWARPGA